MTTRRAKFFTEMAALMKKYDVEMEVREDCSSWQCMADGIDFEFNAAPYEEDEVVGERDPDKDYFTVTCQARYFDSDAMRAMAKATEK